MSFTKFKGVNNIGDSTLTEVIKTNMRYWLDWAFLDIGAYFNVEIPQSGAYGGDESRLRPVYDRRRSRATATTSSVWEGFRGSWVWESGIEQPTQPIQVSGVFVDNVFHPVSGGDHHVDYINGRIVFNTPIAKTSVVRAEYSYRWINVLDANDIPWLRETSFNSQVIDTNKFFNYGSGERSQLGEMRLQLPAIAVETVGRNFAGYQLGGGQWSYNDVIFHVITENGNDADKIADILAEQNDKTIFLFNPDHLADSGAFPLNYQGSIASGAMTYPALVADKTNGGYRSNKLRFSNARKQDGVEINENLYVRPVRVTTEVVLWTI